MRTLKIITITALASFIIACQQVNSTAAEQPPTETEKIQDDILPKAIGYVNDFEGLLTAAETHSLDSLVRAIEKESTIEIVLVSLDSSMVGKEDFDAYTLRLANKWKVGKKKTDNGILIAISTRLRKLRIHNGFGIEKKISNEETGAIIENYMVPALKESKYYDAFRLATEQLYLKIK